MSVLAPYLEKELNLLKTMIVDRINLILDEFHSEGIEEIVEVGMYAELLLLEEWANESALKVEFEPGWKAEIQRIKESKEYLDRVTLSSNS